MKIIKSFGFSRYVYCKFPSLNYEDIVYAVSIDVTAKPKS